MECSTVKESSFFIVLYSQKLTTAKLVYNIISIKNMKKMIIKTQFPSFVQFVTKMRIKKLIIKWAAWIAWKFSSGFEGYNFIPDTSIYRPILVPLWPQGLHFVSTHNFISTIYPGQAENWRAKSTKTKENNQHFLLCFPYYILQEKSANSWILTVYDIFFKFQSEISLLHKIIFYILYLCNFQKIQIITHFKPIYSNSTSH